MRSRRQFLAVLGTSALAGCGYRPGGGDVRWRRSGVGYGGDEIDVAGGTLFSVADSVHTFDLEVEDWITGGQVTAYRTSDGREYWTETFGGELSAHAIGSGSAAVAFDGTLARLGPGGEQWRASIGGELTALGVDGTRVYACSTAAGLVAVEAGEVRWKTGIAVMGTGTGGTSQSERGEDGTEARVGATGSTVVVGSGSGVAAFDREGKRRWRRDDLVADALAVADRGVYVVDGAELLALSADAGQTRWSVGGDRRGASAPPVVTDQAVYYGTETVRVIDRSGDVRWSIKSPHRVGDRPPVAVDDSGVYALSRIEVPMGADDGPWLDAFDHDGTRRWSVAHDRFSFGPFVAESGVLVGAEGDLVCHVR